MTDRDAALDADALTPLVYHELRRLAGAYMRRERPGQTLQATALVHEAYLRARLGVERRRTAAAKRWVDYAIGALLFADGVLIGAMRALPAVAAFALALGIVLAALVLEPATDAAAFGEGR
jgi:hypothetical protein